MAYGHLEKSLTKGNLWLYILHLLARRPGAAGEIRRRFHERFSFSPAAITFYVVLYRLEKEGLVKSRRSGTGKVYECTEAGLKTLTKGAELMKRIAEQVML